MIVRDAELRDFDELLPLFDVVHKESIFKDKKIDYTKARQVFAGVVTFDQGFAKIVERDGKVIGCMFGIVAQNHFGIKCTQDIFTFSYQGTDKLIRLFIDWSKNVGAEFVQVSNLTDNARFDKLIQLSGLKPAGKQFIEVF